MDKPVNRFSFGTVVAGLAVLLAIALVSTAVVAEQQIEAPRTTEPTYEYLLYAPLIAKSLSLAVTSTPTPTPTPTPTATPVPVNVSGTYRVVSSNLEENCDGDYTLPSVQDVQVEQNDTNLTMTFLSGTATGSIEPFTGVFRVVQTISSMPMQCPYGCNRTTQGIFNLTATPLTFNARTVFEVLTQQGTVYCTFAFDQAGTRK